MRVGSVWGVVRGWGRGVATAHLHDVGVCHECRHRMLLAHALARHVLGDAPIDLRPQRIAALRRTLLQQLEHPVAAREVKPARHSRSCVIRTSSLASVLSFFRMLKAFLRKPFEAKARTHP